MTDGFEVITARLLDALVGIDRRIPRSSSQVLAVFVRNVLALTVFEALSQTKINDVDLILRLVCSTD